MKAAITFLGFLALLNAPLVAAEKSGAGVFVSYHDGTLTLDGPSGRLVYERVGENYKTYQNNEDGPGSKLVSTVRALSGEKLEGNTPSLTRILPGALVRVDVEAREIHFGFDYRVIGTLVSYEHGKLTILAADVPPGFVKRVEGKVTVMVNPDVPVLESINGGHFKFAGAAEKALKAAKPGVPIAVRSQYDPEVVEVVEIGQPKQRMERYFGENRGTVRGAFLSFNNDILRIRGKGVGTKLVNDYERVFARRIGADVPIVESIDGGEYRPATLDTLKSLQEGAIVTVRKVEDVLIEIQIGIPKQK